jgi:hypothetical protein
MVGRARELKDKLKCLVFIAIIPSTYCDPKSFSWEHEFIAFDEQASQDQKKDASKNVLSRVAEVCNIKIHPLA